MAKLQKAPLRALTEEERRTLMAVARAGSERADRVARAKALLAVAQGASFTAAAGFAGRRSGRGVATLVARFNRTGLAALDSRHGGGPPSQYGPAERERILREFRRSPDRERDGAATWSLTRALGPSCRPCGKPGTPGSRAAHGARRERRGASANAGR